VKIQCKCKWRLSKIHPPQWYHLEALDESAPRGSVSNSRLTDIPLRIDAESCSLLISAYSQSYRVRWLPPDCTVMKQTHENVSILQETREVKTPARKTYLTHDSPTYWRWVIWIHLIQWQSDWCRWLWILRSEMIKGSRWYNPADLLSSGLCLLGYFPSKRLLSKLNQLEWKCFTPWDVETEE